MSQKDSKFQSKNKKFGGPKGGKFGGRAGKPGGGFAKRSEGDSRSFGDRKPFKRREDESGSRRGSGGGKSFGARKPFQKSDDDFGGGRAFGDRKPFKRRDEDGGSRGFGGDRKPFKKRDGDFGDRKPFKRRDDEGGSGRSFGGGKSFGDRKPFKRRDEDGGSRGFGGGERKPFKRRDDEGGRPFGDRKPFKKRDGDFGGKKPFGKKSFDKKPRRDDRSTYAAPRTVASDETRLKLKSDRASYGAPSPAYLHGHHPVRAALLNKNRKIKRILATEESFEKIQDAYEEASAAGINLPAPIFVQSEDIERLAGRGAVHQDVLVDAAPLEDVFLIDFLNSASKNAKVLILDQVTDPHNVGAILRSASAFGAEAVIVQKLHAPEITGTLAKSASGAVEVVPIIREVNLSRAIEQLKEAGFFCLGLDERGDQTIADAAPKGDARVALVLGAEGEGLRRLVGEKCDQLVSLPTEGPIASLNVSNAAAVALYELIRNK